MNQDKKEIKFQLCGNDSDPAEYFLGNRKLSEQEAHARFMKLTPNVLNDHKNFINEVTKGPTIDKGQPISSSMINMIRSEPQAESQNKKTKSQIANAQKCSEFVPTINHINKNDDDDDNSSNYSKLMDLLMASSNGSVLATIELATILAKTKAPGEIMENCNNYNYTSHPQICAQSLY